MKIIDYVKKYFEVKEFLTFSILPRRKCLPACLKTFWRFSKAFAKSEYEPFLYTLPSPGNAASRCPMQGRSGWIA